MSALPVITPATHQPDTSRPDRSGAGRRRLRLVPRPRARMARLPFLTVLIGLVGAGMVGLLLLNTSLQNQAFEATQLRRQAAEMSYAEGELEQLLTEAQSARELGRRATALGMRPNRDVAFVALPDGTISGDPRASDGRYLPSALTRSPEEIAQERRDRAAQRADARRAEEQRVLDQHRQRIIDARTQELEERRRAAEAAQEDAEAARDDAPDQAEADGSHEGASAPQPPQPTDEVSR